jgi:serine/threonine-protein kinase
MPYEQAITAKNADGRSDIYSLGATLYHLVTGVVPFPGSNHVEVVESKDRGEFAPASSVNPDLPATLDPILARMMARHPRDRYQTVSELIVDLERSHLAAVVPSFADPDQVRKDPYVQARLTANAEPTRLDPESPSRRLEDAWVLRYRNRAGQVRKAKATTVQIMERLRDGRLPPAIQLSRVSAPEFHPPSHYPEFQAVAQSLRARRKERRTTSDPEVPNPPAVPPQLEKKSTTQRWRLLILAAVAVVALAGLAALLIWAYSS